MSTKGRIETRTTGRIFFTVLFLVAGFWLVAPATFAATFNVDSTADAVDAVSGNGSCATSTQTCTLRAAVQESSVLSGADVINLPAGTYTLTLTGPDEDGGATGDLDVLGSITITGAGLSSTTINGNASDRVFHARPLSVLTISGVTISGGKATGTSSWVGGGIFADQATLDLSDCQLLGNSASSGGGVAVISTIMTMTRCLVLENSADSTIGAGGGDGGGVYGNSSRITVQESSLVGNNADGQGAAFFADKQLDQGEFVALLNTTVSGQFSKTTVVYTQFVKTKLYNTTIAGNTDSSGSNAATAFKAFGTGGTYPLEIANTIVANAPMTDCAIINMAVSNPGNNISQDASCSFTGLKDMESTDPRLDALNTPSGEFLMVQLPKTNSPAIDNGNDIVCLAHDELGTIRPQDGNGDTVEACDIGAIEYVPEPALPVLALAALLVLGGLARVRGARSLGSGLPVLRT